MTPQEVAIALDGREYGNEITDEMAKRCKEAGIVVVFGGSDDLIEFRGAIDDERGAPGEVHLTRAGLVVPTCEDEDCPHEKRIRDAAPAITSHWGQEGFSFTYSTTEIPHETFIIKEDGQNYCRGIVFALDDVPAGRITA